METERESGGLRPVAMSPPLWGDQTPKCRSRPDTEERSTRPVQCPKSLRCRGDDRPPNLIVIVIETLLKGFYYDYD